VGDASDVLTHEIDPTHSEGLAITTSPAPPLGATSAGENPAGTVQGLIIDVDKGFIIY